MQIYFVECVSKIRHILSVIQYVGLYVFSLPISLVMIERKNIQDMFYYKTMLVKGAPGEYSLSPDGDI